MNFELTDRCKDFQERVNAFMDERIYPAEAVYEEQMREAFAIIDRGLEITDMAVTG